MQRNRRTGVGVAVMIVVLAACAAMVLSPLGSLAGSAGGARSLSVPAAAGAPAAAGPGARPQGDFGGASCTVTVNGENVGNDAIQTAIDSVPAGSTVCVAAGIYPEQLTISEPLTLVGAGNASTVIEPNAPLSANTFDYDSSATYADLTPAVAIVLVENTTDVAIDDLTVNGSSATSTFSGCGVDYYGIDFQDSSGSVNGTSVVGIELPAWLFGCQPGVALYAYNGYFFTGEVPSPSVDVAVENSSFLSYDKGGIVCDDLGEECQIVNNTVTGVGANTSIAQNGIQVAFGASAVVESNTVSGNHYTGVSASPGDDYFAPGYLSAGILIFDAASHQLVESNTLSGNDLGIAAAATPQVAVDGNDIEQGFGYGITLDLNASPAYVGLPIYGGSLADSSTVLNDQIQNVNVGVLVYDDNVSLEYNEISGVNVGVETLLDDAAATYQVSLAGGSITANVSGALFGNLSSFQSTAGFFPQPIGSYLVSSDAQVLANPLAPSASVADGLAFYGATVWVIGAQVSGFAIGIYVNPSATATVESNTVREPASLAEPEIGIWDGNLVYPTTADSGIADVSENVVVGPGGGPGAPVAGGTGILAAAQQLRIYRNVVENFSAVAGSGGGNGYDWWEGTQSVGIMAACPTTEVVCQVSNNSVRNNAIGLAVLLTNASFSAAYATGPIVVIGNDFNDSGGYGIFTEMVWTGGPRSPSLIANNTFNDTLSGAPAMVLSGQLFDVENNVLIGTSTSGNQGPSQGQGGGPLQQTASIEATDYWTTGYTTVVLQDNLFLDTDVYWNATFAGFATGPSSLSGGILATFNEVGLPGGTNWTMTIGGTFGYVPAGSTIVADLQNGTNDSFVAGRPAGYVPVPPSGYLLPDGTNLTQTIDYSLASYLVTFTETGVPTGLTWYLNLSNGQKFSSVTTTISFGEPNGIYDYMFGGTPQFPKYFSALPGSFTVNGAPLGISVTFRETRQVVITEHGLPGGMTWWANFTGGSSFSSSGPTLTAYLPAGSWTYTLQAADHDYHAAGHSFVVHNPLALPHKALHFTAAFKVTKYAIHFTESGLPSGSRWCVAIASGGITCSRAATLTFSEPNGSYDYSLATSRAGYSATGGSFTIPGTSSVSVTFVGNGGRPAALPAVARAGVPSARTSSAASLELIAAALGISLGLAAACVGGRRRSG